ncbi:hypothetical protein Q4595_25565, partial [Wenyingzhuangia sp. 1_MG-2023]|nr:hypothetical protein [Wenyingzhuangia sp. 1_MG-2023]
GMGFICQITVPDVDPDVVIAVVRLFVIVIADDIGKVVFDMAAMQAELLFNGVPMVAIQRQSDAVLGFSLGGKLLGLLIIEGLQGVFDVA